MEIWRSIWKEINKAGTSTYCENGEIKVRDNSCFKPLPAKVHDSINEIVGTELKANLVRAAGGVPLESLQDVRARSGRLVPVVLNSWQTSKPLTANVRDSIMNYENMYGVVGQDPARASFSYPNLYISPYEAMSVYSQGGIFSAIIDKKSKSILLNGVKIKNPKFTPEQSDKVRDDMLKCDFITALVDATTQSLLCGGALMFPMFKKDSPLSTKMSVEQLLKYGVLGKNSIQRYIVLDKWNTVHIPQYNPTASDFLNPKQYYIPFLGSHVCGERTARVLAKRQYGYFANMALMGWSVSDVTGWIESAYDYMNVMNSIPMMIQQMSILVRSFNVDGILATEGADILHDIDLEGTMRTRQASVDNPINIDTIGQISSIQRDFKEVPNLVRLMRQHLGGNAGIPEELLWSSDKGAFSSGDTTSGALERVAESIKYIQRDIGSQMKKLAMIQVINALGKDRDVLSILPYTTVEFDNQIVTNAEERSKIATNLGKTALDMTAAGIPSDAVLDIVNSYGDEQFQVRSDLMQDLVKRQKLLDSRTEEKHEKEMDLLQAQIDQIKASTSMTEFQMEHPQPMGGFGKPGGGGASTPGVKGKTLTSSSGGGGYSRLQQKQKEKSRGTGASRESLESRIEKNHGTKASDE